ncbi:hypothetical protein Syun_004962 [Stephania yunnanensis]|uniref:30S ribosomal protein S9, chloroplastic n=1 Tax=Stephania yunnanensis TaxID=152371 RepID=A0AAP0L4X0_9MAGN
MAISLSSLTSSFSSLSFSSQISSQSKSLYFTPTPNSPPKFKPAYRPTRLAPIASASAAAAVASPVEPETANLEKYVKSRLPGGFAAQTIIGTGRRKCAIARVVLQEGTGKVIINYRDAKVRTESLDSSASFSSVLCYAPLNRYRNWRADSLPAPALCIEREVEEDLVKAATEGMLCSVLATINDVKALDYLQGNPLWLQYIKVPLMTLGFESSYDVFVKAHGGGLSGQAQAISLGVARALLKLSENYRSSLRKEGLLTRDARVVERKKVGLKKARKAPQFSKR